MPSDEALATPRVAPEPFRRVTTLPRQGPLRMAIARHHRAPEDECIAALLPAATLPPWQAGQAAATARHLVEALRRKGAHGAVEALVQAFPLASPEGLALMGLAEALLRIPDAATRDALIRDKLAGVAWGEHLGRASPPLVRLAAWGLSVTGRLVGAGEGAAGGAEGPAALRRLLARGSAPAVRRGLGLAMRRLGEQFVAGETIGEALARARRAEARGFRHSYDMLGEAALTAADAARYHADYEAAIHAIGAAAAGRPLHDGPGISIKLSALHPRYVRAQHERVMAELLPRVAALAALAKRYGIGLNIDAEEADRLDLSLDLLESLCADPALAGWDGLGFVVQAYQKRAPFVLDFVIDLARRSGRRLMLRLVKGAYWDSEIKRAQVEGLEDFPVFTRKAHTDVSYLACARQLLDARDAVFAQFATHNAQTVAAILAMAGEAFQPGDYEFQCLHGMGEPLYEAVVGPSGLNRPCRIYAPVGTHETLLAYLVRRLLENGANSSFVNRIQDPAVPVEALAADPAAQVAATVPVGAPNPRIARPRDLFGTARANSAGLDLASEDSLAWLAVALKESVAQPWAARPVVAGGGSAGRPRPVLNPADRRDVVGQVVEAGPAEAAAALLAAEAAAPGWRDTAPAGRAACLLRAADLLEQRMPALLGLLVREAGKSLASAASEVREAVDFLRYYGAQARDGFSNATHRPLGPVLCISPWNFPLAIFTGQVAAALAAGNPVLAKPAEETPLIAAQAIGILQAAGVPEGVLQFLPGDGALGAALVADARVRGVLFTGSTEVARLIQRELAKRLNPDGTPVPLVAETGGQNAMIVESSALAEQVVADVLVSAFDSAGQRCSALRLLCLQDEVADRTLTMLLAAVTELSTGNPDRLSTDVGPVITDEARDGILAHVEAMRRAGRSVHQAPLAEECRHGSFVPPTVIEVGDVSELTREVFGPVLHVLRFRREKLEAVVEAVNATGYGLTFGVQSRIEETVARASGRARAGNVYVNRNLVGAVVGVQPFGGHGLSGTGPKAGGPLYLRRLLATCPLASGLPPGERPEAARIWADWLEAQGEAALAVEARRALAASPLGVLLELPGPVGERNLYATEARGRLLCEGATRAELFRAIGAALATGNRAVVERDAMRELGHLPPALRGWIGEGSAQGVQAVLCGNGRQRLLERAGQLAAREGPIVPLHAPGPEGGFPLDMLVRERATSINTTAAGGNASLLALD